MKINQNQLNPKKNRYFFERQRKLENEIQISDEDVMVTRKAADGCSEI